MVFMKTLTIRPARLEDAPAISALIRELLPYMTVAADGSGAEAFVRTLQASAIAVCLGDSRYRYQLGWLDGQLAGVVAVRDGSHLFHLFVARALHGRGLGRQLWQAARVEAPAGTGFTVNSSVFALPMYQRFGFEAQGAVIERDGIAYIPMRWDRPRAAENS